MEQPIAGTENSEENPTEKYSPSDTNDTNQVTKDEISGQGKTL